MNEKPPQSLTFKGLALAKGELVTVEMVTGEVFTGYVRDMLRRGRIKLLAVADPGNPDDITHDRLYTETTTRSIKKTPIS